MMQSTRLLALLCAVITRGTSSQIIFVPALPFDSAADYREDHIAACTRNGLIPTAFQVSTSSFGQELWTPAAAAAVTASLLLPTGSTASFAAPSSQCCVNSLWCSGAPTLLCVSHGYGDLMYTNYGWTSDSSSAPVYTCTASALTSNLTAMSLAVPRVKAARIIVAPDNSTVRVQVDGVGFGTSVAALSVQLAGVACLDVDVCHDTCDVCASDSDCGDDKSCISIPSLGSYCLRQCNFDNSCPCGGSCYRILQGASASQVVCANTDAQYGVPFCGSGDWKPAPSTRWDSRIECSPPNFAVSFANGYPVGPGQTDVSSFSSLLTLQSQRRLGRSAATAVRSSRLHDVDGAAGAIFEPVGPKHRADNLAPAPQPSRRRLAPVAVVSRVTGYSPLTGWRYGSVCSSRGAVLAGQPSLIGVLVSAGGLASTGLGTTKAASAGLPASNPNPAPFSGLPYTGLLLGLNYSLSECLDDSWCLPVDLCTTPRCVMTPGVSGGCCTYVPNGACESALPAPASGQKPFSATYFALPRELSAVLPLPPPPNGNGDSALADMSNRSPSANPNAIVWSTKSPWLGVAPFRIRQAGYGFSDAGYGYVTPQPPASLRFEFPFFGYQVSQLYLSPSGFARVVADLPCGEAFSAASTRCDLASGYSGILGPLVAEFNPGAYGASEVWYASGNLSFTRPEGSDPGAASMLVFCATWLNMGLHSRRRANANIPPDPDFSMHMCVYGDGAVRWRYGAVLGVPGFLQGAWPSNAVVPSGGGPPNASDSAWIAGLRSMSSTFRVASAADLYRNARWRKYTSAAAASDVQPGGAWPGTGSGTDLLVTAPGVRQGGTAAFCAHNPIAVLSPSCGSEGTSVVLQWSPPGCGLGFEALLKGSGAVDGQPQLLCMFGDVSVVATVTPAPANSSFFLPLLVTCIAPAKVAFAGSLNTSGAFSLPLQLRIAATANSAIFASNNSAVVSPQTGATAAAFGVGPAALSFDAPTQRVLVPLDVHGVRAVAVRNSTSSGSTYIALVPHPLSFTYLSSGDIAAGVSCGCAHNNASVADACGICGGNGRFVDCAGTCFGAAFIDDCGTCVGGTTGAVKNALMDCNGACQAPGSPRVVCPSSSSPTPTSEDDWTLTIIVIAALVTCSFVLLLLLGWVALAAHRRRVAYDDAIAEFLAQDERVVRPGLSDEALAMHPVKPAPALPPGTSAPEPCSICMEPMNPGEPCRFLAPCRHCFHVLCSDTWLGRNTTCPVCRADLRTEAERTTAAAARAAAEARFTQRTGLAIRPQDPPPAAPPRPAAPVGAAGDPLAPDATDAVSSVTAVPASPTSVRTRTAAAAPEDSGLHGSTAIEMAPLGGGGAGSVDRSGRSRGVGGSPGAGSGSRPLASALAPSTGPSPRVAGTVRQTTPLVSSGRAGAGSAGNGPGRVVTPTTITVIGSVHSDGDFSGVEHGASQMMHENPIGGDRRRASPAIGSAPVMAGSSRRSSAGSSAPLVG